MWRRGYGRAEEGPVEEKGRGERFTTVISVAALVVSIVSAIFSLRLQSIDANRSTRDQLSSTIRELIRLNSENSALYFVPQAKRDSRFYQAYSTIMETAAVLSRQAVFLAEQRRELVSDVEFGTIAQGLVLAGDILLADTYFQRAIEKSANAFYKVVNTRSYANFLFNQGKHQQGREFYQKALDIVTNDSDFHKSTNAYTYQMWMVSEANHRMWEEAERNYLLAKRLFESLANPVARDSALRALELAYKSVYTPPPPPEKPARNG